MSTGIRPEEHDATEEAERALLESMQTNQHHNSTRSAMSPMFGSKTRELAEKNTKNREMRKKLIADPETMNSELLTLERDSLVPYELLKDRKMMREQQEMNELKNFADALQRELAIERGLRKEYQTEREKIQLELHSVMQVRKQQVQTVANLERSILRLKKKNAELSSSLTDTERERDRVRQRFEYFRDECYIYAKEIRKRDEHAQVLKQRMQAVASLTSKDGRKNISKSVRKKVHRGIRWVLGMDDDDDDEFEVDVNGFCYECRHSGNCPNGFAVDTERYPPHVCCVCQHERHEHLFIDGLEEEDEEEEDMASQYSGSNASFRMRKS